MNKLLTNRQKQQQASICPRCEGKGELKNGAICDVCRGARKVVPETQVRRLEKVAR